jgi:mannose-6-phosphate isomerase-like protein (cupin superfamily)
MEAKDVDIIDMARRNDDFRREVITGAHSQVVLMAIPPDGEIGEEVHPGVDQILLFVEGQGEAILEGDASGVDAGELVFVPSGTRHNFRNTGAGPLKLVTVYSPPEHPPGTVHHSKEEADAAEQG